MMRFQRVSPDCLPLSNGKKSNMNGRISPTTTTNVTTSCSNLEGKGLRFRSPTRSQEQYNEGAPTSQDSPPPLKTSGSGDMLLQWGQRKKARVSRSDTRPLTLTLTDDSSSSSSSAIKLHTRLMPPPPPPPLPSSATSNSTRPTKDTSASLLNRNLEERSGSGGNGSPSRNSGNSNRVVSRSMAGKRSPPREKVDRKMMMPKDEKPNPNGSDHRMNHAPAVAQPQQEPTATATASPFEKPNLEVIEWPRIYVALSRKEKEDDFLAMKGTKLPQRPKKRTKNIDKALQYCFPGMWLSDLTRSRYEVREKKCVKKQKRRGLKGMESLDSESE